MGLGVSHGCWRGPYSAFMRWRKEVAKAAGLPPLTLMEGFYYEGGVQGDPFFMLSQHFKDDDNNIWQIKEMKESFPIKWSSLKRNPLHKLLYHSDCDGSIYKRDCLPIAKALEKIIHLIPKHEEECMCERVKTQKFIDGLKLAHKNNEKVTFG